MSHCQAYQRDADSQMYGYIDGYPYPNSNSDLFNIGSLDKWDRRGLAVAKLVSIWSKDPSTKVGAYLSANDRHTPVNFGYNGPPHSLPDEDFDLSDRELKLGITIHAEQNCLIGVTRQEASETTLYVYGLAPCSRCAAIIIQLGIRRVVAYGHNNRWDDDLAITKYLFETCNPSVEFIHLWTT